MMGMSKLALLAGALAGALSVGQRLNGQVPGELRGRVADALTVLPVADARVEIVGRPEATQSGPDGFFTVRGLEPRTYTVRVRAIGYLPRQVEVEIANGRTALIEVTLDAAPTALAAVVVSAARDTQPMNATVFDRRAIEKSGRRDVGELLQSVPGVVITQEGGPGAASHVSIRGSGASEVLVLVDGVALNSPITGEADLSGVPLEGVERVAVRTGAQSARYGGRALAGVIEIQTRRPARDASLLLRAGAWGERNASVSIGESRPAGSLRVGGSLTADYRTLDGDFRYDLPALRGGGTARRLNAGVSSRLLLGTLSLRGDTRSVALRGSWQDLSRGLAGSIVQPSLTGRERQNRRELGLDASWRRGMLAWTVAGDVTREGANFGDPSPPFGTKYRDTVTATAITVSSELAAGGENLSASIGGEARSMDLSSTMLAADAPRSQRLLGAFGGLRASRRLGDAGTRIGIDASARVDHSSLVEGSIVSARAVASVSRGIVVASASLGSGYAPPSLADQFFHEGVLVRPNPGLKPERTRRDVEGRIAIRDATVGPARLSGEVAAYRANIDGMILWLPDFRFIWSPANYAVERSGWELSGAFALPSLGLGIQGMLNRSDVAYDGPVLDGQVAYRPRATGSVTVSVDAGFATLEIANNHVGERRTVPGSSLNALAPYWRTDARIASSRPWGSWELEGSLAVANLFDRPAAMLVDYPFPSRGWTVTLRVRRADTRQLR